MKTSITSVLFLSVFLFNSLSSVAQNRNGAGFIVAGTRPPDATPVEGKPLEERATMGKGQKSAFEGQTRAKAAITKTPYEAVVVTDKLDHPWAIAFLPDGRMLISEKSGSLRIVTQQGVVGAPLSGVPKVVYMGDAGLLDVAVDPDFSSNRTFYFTYVEQRQNGSGLSVASARISKDETQLEQFKVIYRVGYEGRIPAHYGSRLLFDKQGKLLVSTSERMMDDVRVRAQWLSSDLGKILRLNKDGSPAEGNPVFKDSLNARKEIWAYGIRNPQGLSIHPETGELWESEHGPQGGDEINVIQPGKNYGWPIIAYGTEYTGNLINDGKSAQQGMEQPVYYWDPAIAPSGIAFYSGRNIPEWKNNLFVSALAGQHLSRLVFANGKVIAEERLLLDQHQRIRDVAESPDGNLWIVTDADNGRLIRIAPKK